MHVNVVALRHSDLLWNDYEGDPFMNETYESDELFNVNGLECWKCI